MAYISGSVKNRPVLVKKHPTVEQSKNNVEHLEVSNITYDFKPFSSKYFAHNNYLLVAKLYLHPSMGKLHLILVTSHWKQFYVQLLEKDIINNVFSFQI